MSYAKFIYNKNVCIVGGVDNYDADYVETFDIVVRINNHWLRQGGSCHVVYHCGKSQGPFSIHHLLQQLQKPTFIIHRALKKNVQENKQSLSEYYPQHVFIPFKRKRTNQIPGFEWLTALEVAYDCSFFTGTIALAHVLQHSPKFIFACGMNLYCNTKHENNEINGHKIPGNINYLSDIQNNTSRVKFDAPLKEAIDFYT